MFSFKRWYNQQISQVMESCLKTRIDQNILYDQKPFYAATQRIEARRQICSKEIFDQYVINKLALVLNSTQFTTIRYYYLTNQRYYEELFEDRSNFNANTVEEFLEKMRQITDDIFEQEKKNMAQDFQISKYLL